MYARISNSRNENVEVDHLDMMAKHNYEESIKNEQRTLTAEVIHLQYKVLFNLAKVKMPSQFHSLNRFNITSYTKILYECPETHHCDSGCNFLSLKKNSVFIYEITGQPTRATGLVFVCSASGKEHICGKHCNKKILTSKSDSISCQISGICFEGAYQPHPFSTANEIKVNNNKSQDIVFCITNEEDGKIIPVTTSERKNRDSSLLSFRMKKKGQSIENSNPVLGKSKRLYEEIKYGVNRVSNGFFDLKDAIPENNTKKRRKKNNYNDNVIKTKTNISNMRTIRTTVKNMLYAPNKSNIIKAIEKNRYNDVESQVSKYSQICMETNKTPLHCDILSIYMSHISPSHRMLNTIDLSLSEDTEIINYYSNCINVLWQIMNGSTSCQKNRLNFTKTIISLLYMLKDGYSVQFYVDKEGYIVKKYNKMIDDKNSSVYGKPVDFELIPKHTQLDTLLIPSSDVKSIRKSSVKTGRGKSDNFFKNVSVMNGMRKIKGSYENIFELMFENKKANEKIDPEKMKQYMLSSYIN